MVALVPLIGTKNPILGVLAHGLGKYTIYQNKTIYKLFNISHFRENIESNLVNLKLRSFLV